MHRAIRFAPLLVLALTLACSSLRVNVDYDPEEDFSTYRTYTWFPAEQRQQGDYRVDNPLLDGRIRDAVDREPTPEQTTEDVDGAVKEILARFPPEKKSDG